MSIQNNLTVGDVLLDLDATPQTNGTTLLKEALEMMDRHRGVLFASLALMACLMASSPMVIYAVCLMPFRNLLPL